MTILPRELTGRRATPPDPARTLDTLATALVILLTIGVLYFAREILVPIAIAVLLSFVLSPPVKVLRNIGLGKTGAVGIVVFLAFAFAVGVGYLLTRQIADLAAESSRYQAAVTQKFDYVRDVVTHNPLLGKLNTVVDDVRRVEPAAKKSEPKERPTPSGSQEAGNPSPAQKPTPVEIIQPPPGAFQILQTVGGAAATPLVTAAFVALFIIFILMQREDLRNRFIRVVGFGDLNRTTLAMNEAAARLSRYFLAQVLLNLSFGLIAAVALAIIGVPSAILWGIVAAFMRFIPYLGSIGAALFPVLMAAAATSGWTMAIETAILFAFMEIITGQVIEPLVFGAHTGISPIAVVVSATFWTWLWGPVGLVLSMPLTVCLVVLGKHVERFAFLDVMLGDAPPLTAAQSFYQRMLVGDPSEIVDHAETFLKDYSLLAYCDTVAMRALLMAQRDVRRGALEEERQTVIRDAMREVIDDLAELAESAESSPPDKTAPAAPVDVEDEGIEAPAEPKLPDKGVDERWRRDYAVVCIAGRTPLDEAAADVLASLLKHRGIGVHVEPAESLTKNTVHQLVEHQPELVILSFLDADLSVAQARFAVRRIRRRLPDVPLAAAFWMKEADEARTKALCADVRCETCVSSLPDALALCIERAAAPTMATAA